MCAARGCPQRTRLQDASQRRHGARLCQNRPQAHALRGQGLCTHKKALQRPPLITRDRRAWPPAVPSRGNRNYWAVLGMSRGLCKTQGVPRHREHGTLCTSLLPSAYLGTVSCFLALMKTTGSRHHPAVGIWTIRTVCALQMPHLRGAAFMVTQPFRHRTLPSFVKIHITLLPLMCFLLIRPLETGLHGNS